MRTSGSRCSRRAGAVCRRVRRGKTPQNRGELFADAARRLGVEPLTSVVSRTTVGVELTSLPAVRIRRVLKSPLVWFAVGSVVLTSIVGCERNAPPPAASSAAVPAVEVVRYKTPEELHAALKAKNPDYNGMAQIVFDGEVLTAVDLSATGVSDLGPLAGQSLQLLYAEENPITDLRPLRGLRLSRVSFSNTPVADLTPLRGMPLREEVRLVNTQVRDVGALQGAPIQELWLNNAPVDDISPLAGSPLVSLTVEGTKVHDLTPIRRMPKLERLNIVDSAVTDLTPVAGLPLTRLLFTPSKITQGLDAARGLPMCNEMGPSIEQKMRPDQFWQALDAGAFR
jgi:hypothetical protein